MTRHTKAFVFRRHPADDHSVSSEGSAVGEDTGDMNRRKIFLLAHRLDVSRINRIQLQKLVGYSAGRLL